MSNGRLLYKNGTTRLVFVLSGDVVLSKELLAKSKEADYLVPVQYAETGGECKLVYDAGDMISLTKFLQRNNVVKRDLLQIVKSLCNTFALAEGDGFKLQSFSFNTDSMFWNPMTRGFKLTYFPYETRQQPTQALRAVMLKIAEDLLNVDSSNQEVANAIVDYCNTQKFNLSTFVELLETMEIEKSAQTEEPAAMLPGISAVCESATEFLIREDATELIATAEAEKSIAVSIVIDGIEKKADIQKFPCILGRSLQDANMVLEDKSVSRQHAIFDYTGEGFIIRDNNSSNGVAVNGEKLEPGGNRIIEEGDMIKIGRIEIRIDKVIMQ